MRLMTWFAGLLVGFAAGVAALPANALEVDLELVLAIDISRSVDDEEAQLQREGYMQALTDKRIIDAIRSGALGRIAVTYVEWAGSTYQQTVIDWTVIGAPPPTGTHSPSHSTDSCPPPAARPTADPAADHSRT